MIEIETLKHFNTIAPTWGQKEWVNSQSLNGRINDFLRSTERAAGLAKKRHKTSLYFGIGTGALFRYFHGYNIAGVDASAAMLGQCPEGIIQLLSRVEELPFLMDNQFHLTFSRNLLKHCSEPFMAIQSMFQKTRRGGVAIAIESVVLEPEDSVIPTSLVRTTDPSHPPFLTIEQVQKIFKKSGFHKVEYCVFPHRATWLSRWLAAEQAGEEIRAEILALYHGAPRQFIKRYAVNIQTNEITSTVPWLMVRALK